MIRLMQKNDEVVLLKVFHNNYFFFHLYPIFFLIIEFLVHMTNRLRRRSGSNNDSRDHTNAFLDQSGKLSSSHTREHRYHYQHYQQNSINGHCLSSSSTSSTTTKRKSSDDPNGSNSKRG